MSEDKPVTIKVDAKELESAIRELGLVSGQVEGYSRTLLDLLGMKPVAVFTVISSIFALITKIQDEQKDYETFIRKERGLQTHTEFLNWQRRDKIATLMSYRGDTN